jgi:hypothetical protein
MNEVDLLQTIACARHRFERNKTNADNIASETGRVRQQQREELIEMRLLSKPLTADKLWYRLTATAEQQAEVGWMRIPGKTQPEISAHLGNPSPIHAHGRQKTGHNVSSTACFSKKR